MGIKELKELVVFIAVLANATDKTTKDGLSLNDFADFLPALISAPEALSGLDAAKLEYDDLDEAEKKELSDVFAAEFDITDDKLEGLVESSLTIVIELYAIIQKIKEAKA